MALNTATFKTRTISAIIFAVIMLAGLFWNFWSFFLLFSVIHFGCWKEYQKLIGFIDQEYAQISFYHKYGVMIAGWFVMFYFANANETRPISLHLIGEWGGLFFIIVLPLLEVIFVRNINFKLIGYSLFGLLYISLSLGLLTDIRSRFADDLLSDLVGKILVIMIIGSIWINDTMAYIVGSLIGKTPLSKISPKKTWEGTAGGVILSIIVMSMLSYFLDQQLDWENIIHFGTIAAIASIIGTVGDLLESKLKRMGGVKDSGSFLPGHGGFLDRFDSLLVATPFVWIYIIFFMQ
jgi:phosphatidate cytidylyltransferase